jgi:crotonobetainyl-CoA:carnitine CoA-transferase CaiB-like acyl-CoA transferase
MIDSIEQVEYDVLINRFFRCFSNARIAVVGTSISIAHLVNPNVAFGRRALRFNLPHANGLDVPQVANPVRFSATPIDYRQAPPTLGQHSREVLVENLGLSAAEIAALVQSGVVALADAK